MADQPRINGIDYDYASIEVKADGVLYISIQSINYRNSLKPGKVRGTHAMALGRTTGQYEPTASMELHKSAANQLRQQLGEGYMTKSFDLVINYAPEGQPIITDEIIGCRCTEADNSHSEGTDGLTETWELDPHAIVENGIRPIANMFV